MKHGYFTDFVRKMRHDILVYKEKDKRLEESFANNASARYAFSTISARKSSARDQHSSVDRNDGNRRSMEEISLQRQHRASGLGNQGDRNLKTSHQKYRKPNGNLLSVRQPSKKEVERYLSRDPKFLNNKELTLEKSFLEEWDQLRKDNLGQDPNYNTIAETRAAKYREKTMHEAINTFESMIEEMRHTQRNFSYNRGIYDLREKYKGKKSHRS